jgi:hypothetical protein
MTIRPSDAYLMYTTNRTSQLSQITYRGAIALQSEAGGPDTRESRHLHSGVQTPMSEKTRTAMPAVCRWGNAVIALTRSSRNGSNLLVMPELGGSTIATRDARARGPRYLFRGRHAAEAPVVPWGEVRSAAPAPIQFNWAAMRVFPIGTRCQ